MQIRSATNGPKDIPLHVERYDYVRKLATSKSLAVSLVINLLFLGLLVWRLQQNGWYFSTKRLAGNNSVALKTTRLELFRMSDSARAEEPLVVMFGDSLAQGGFWSEWFGAQVLNRGIGGDTSADALARVDEIIALRPSVVFVEFGTNDSGVLPPEETARNVEKIVATLRASLPNCKIVVFGLLPGRTHQRDAIAKEVNERIAGTVGRDSFLDMSNAFSTPTGVISPELTSDGTHLSAEGYRRWCAVLDDKYHGELLPYSRFHSQAALSVSDSQSRR
jgi:lysophospholipase L1-like esterase